MRQLHGNSISAPSSSLLRFLRSQAENVCFFTPTTPGPQSTLCIQNLRRASEVTSKSGFKQTRHFRSCPRQSATVESSLISLNFWQRGRKQDIDSAVGVSSLAGAASNTKLVFHEPSRTQRFASNDARPLFQKLWTIKRQKAGNSPKDLPPLPRYLVDAHGPALGFSSGKASNELKLRCTEFDENGNVTHVNGEFKKSELIAMVRQFIWPFSL